MKPSEEHWNRWIDGDFSSPEEQQAIEDEMGASTDREFFSLLSKDLKATFPIERQPPAPDFFNHQIQKRLRELESPVSPISKASLWAIMGSWFRSGWMVPATAAVVLVGTFLFNSDVFDSAIEGSQIVHTYTPDESLKVETSYHSSANVMVVRLSGMDVLPDNFDLKLTRAGETEEAKIAIDHQVREIDAQDPSDTSPIVALH